MKKGKPLDLSQSPVYNLEKLQIEFGGVGMFETLEIYMMYHQLCKLAKVKPILPKKTLAN